tara:strand:+ start:337 stop:1080 length:744 start_codon:yes stop_codon:yes gene_type:complete
MVTGNEIDDDIEGLVFLGDSFVESIFSHEESRFVSRVERELAASGIPRRCLNGGYSGTTSLQLVNILLNKVYPLIGAAGTVILFVPQSDVKLLADEASYWTSSDLYASLLPPAVAEATELAQGLESTRRVLQIAVSVARELGIKLVLVSSPYRSAPHGEDAWLAERLRGDTYNRLLGWRKDLAATVSRVAADNGIPFIDAASYMRNQPDCFYDELHLNSKGQFVFSSWLAHEISDYLGAPASLNEPE